MAATSSQRVLGAVQDLDARVTALAAESSVRAPAAQSVEDIVRDAASKVKVR